MLSQKLFNYLMSANYSLDESMSGAYNNSMTSDRKEFHIPAKTINRREPALSHNVTLLIEFGIVVVVMVIVGLVFYFSQRNFKKRCNVHRRRWLESDVNIDDCGDGQIYDINTTLEDSQSLPMDLDQDDYPPPYETVVQQSNTLLKQKDHASRSNIDKLDQNSPKCQSNCCEKFPEALLASQSLNCISTISNEHSSLIESGHAASTSSSADGRNGNVERIIRPKYSESEFKVQRVPNSQLERASEGETQTEERSKIVPTTTAECENEIALLDASGLPSYDSALKIQECGNM